jgi:hypothetical protein
VPFLDNDIVIRVGKSAPPKVDIREGTYSSAKYGRKDGYFKVTSKVIL